MSQDSGGLRYRAGTWGRVAVVLIALVLLVVLVSFVLRLLRVMVYVGAILIAIAVVRRAVRRRQ